MKNDFYEIIHSIYSLYENIQIFTETTIHNLDQVLRLTVNS